MIDDIVNKFIINEANRKNVDKAVDSFFKQLQDGASKNDLQDEIDWVVSELKLQAGIK